MHYQLQADEFLKAFEALIEAPELRISSHVCLALALEAQTKALLQALGKSAPQGETTKTFMKLYKKLPKDVQTRVFKHPAIQENFDFLEAGFEPLTFTWFYTPKHAFYDELQAISHSLKQWHTTHDNFALNYNTLFAGVLVEALKGITAEVQSTV